MPALFEPSDIPAWMNPTRNILEQGRESLPIIARNFMEAYSMAQQNKSAAAILHVQDLKYKIQQEATQIKQMDQATTEVASWMRDSGGDPVWMTEHPYTGTNPMAAEQINSAQIRASQSISVTKAKEDLTQFNTRLSKLPPDARAAIQGMSDDPRTKLPTAMKWTALGLAEQSEQIRMQNDKTAAELEAAQRGDVETTRVTSRGVESIYKPAPAGAASQMGEPTVKELPDGSKLIHVSPNRWQYVKGENKKEMSTGQLMAISKSFKELDPNDATAKAIDEHLKTEAQSQIAKTPDTVKSSANVVTDKSGAKWIYKGSMVDPTQDKDPTHWERQ